MDKIKFQLRTYVESITKKSKGTNMYICPLCGSGTKTKNTGAFSIKDDKSWKCFSCNEGGDIFDLIGKYEGIPEYYQQLKKAEEIFGLDSDQKHFLPHKIKSSINYSQFFLQANKNIIKTNYHRGISLETLNRFQIGYIENWRHPKAPKSPVTPRLIIPTSNESYLARDTRNKVPNEQKAYIKSKVGSVHIFNAKALQLATKPIFIVEGEIDALSIIDVGGEAIALGSTANIKTLLTILETNKPSQSLIISMDNDEAGNRAQQELINGLEKLLIPFYTFNIAMQYKDANEALNADRENFKIAVRHAENIQDELRQTKLNSYLNSSAAYYLKNFINDTDTKYISTGFKNLDTVLDGGLCEGLYIIGAISSLGKTTFIIQMADQIAQTGQDILIFSLEMSRMEIIAKSISRHTIEQVLTNNGDIRNAKTSRGITTKKRYENYSDTEKNLINKAISNYGQYAKHIFIHEGTGKISTKQIREAVEQHISFTGNTPIVIIDYLQILAPYNERATDKQNIDKAIIELK